MGRVKEHPILYPLIASVLIMVISAALFVWIDRTQDARHRGQQRAYVLTQLAAIRANFEKVLNSHLGSINALEAIILTQAEISQRDFETVAEVIRRDHPAIREVQLSPDAVVKFVYPLAGNEESIGLDLLKLPPDQADLVRATIQNGQTILAGPVELVQGGVALIARRPIFVTVNTERRFWGFVTIILDFPEVLAALGSESIESGIQLAIRGRDGTGADGLVFFGDPGLFADPESVLAEVTLPLSGRWLLAGAPPESWAASRPGATGFRLLGMLVTVSLGLLAWLAAARGVAMRHAAMNDCLTGALNRRAFEKYARLELERAARYGHTVSLLMLDLDHFKTINDTWGHAAGDAVLKQSVEIIASDLRANDLLGRIGGEEFAVVLPETDKMQAVVLAERICHRVADTEYSFAGRPLPVTLSVGVVECGSDGAGLEALMKTADGALYRAKQWGRNRVCKACSEQCLLARAAQHGDQQVAGFAQSCNQRERGGESER